jgi:hypothetical protein
MKLTPFVMPAALLLALSVVAAPAHADEAQNRGSEHARHAQNRTPPRSGQERAGAQTTSREGRAQARRVSPAPRTERQVQPYPSQSGAQRIEPRAVPRGNVYAAPYRNESRGREYSRPGDVRRDHDGDRDRYRGRSYGYAPYAYSPYHYGYRPYYTFRPRVRLSFGLYLGYPVAYPYAIYPSPRVYGYYPPPGTVTVAPSYSSYGGISLAIGPPDADVWVDGQYVGRAEDFGPSEAPLTMTPGRHHIELAAPGYETLAFDVDVVPGQVIPYQGTLRIY